ncbi:MAG: (2Fe-2S) ferredoxin domain-containing protein [Oscillospiraceae bacterium]
MKTLADLEAIRKTTLDRVTLRKDTDGTRVVVGMATCGIAAGARPVMNAFMEEIATRNVQNVTITQTGCIGMCRLEPIVEIYSPNGEKVTYVKMTPEKAVKVVAEHIVNGRPVAEYTIGATEE